MHGCINPILYVILVRTYLSYKYLCLSMPMPMSLSMSLSMSPSMSLSISLYPSIYTCIYIYISFPYICLFFYLYTHIYICSPPHELPFVFFTLEKVQTIISTLVQTQNNKTKKHNFKFTLVHEGQEGQQMNSDIKRRKSY